MSTARYKLSIKADSGYSAVTEGACTPEQYGAAIAALAAQPGAVPADCDVRKILIDVVPGDGDGYEVYAKSNRDVETKLGELWSRLEDWEMGIRRLPATEAKPAQDAVGAERLPPMPENVLADIQQAHEYVSMWAKGEAYYAPVSAYDDMLGKRKATIKDVMKSAKFIAPRLMSASLAMRDYFAAIDVYANKKGGV